MSEHDAFYEELPLAAAGALDASEERELRRHLARCELCPRELDELQRLTSELSARPTPTAPTGAVERVRRLVHLELAGRADERLDRMVFVFLLTFSWTATIAGFVAMRLLTAEGTLFFRLVTQTGIPMNAIYFGVTWLGGAAMLVLLGLRNRNDRAGESEGSLV